MKLMPAIDREVELRVRLGLAVLLAPGHGAEAHGGDAQVGAGQRAVVQDELLVIKWIDASF